MMTLSILKTSVPYIKRLLYPPPPHTHSSTLHLFADEKLTENKQVVTVRWEDVDIQLMGPINEIWGKF